MALNNSSNSPIYEYEADFGSSEVNDGTFTVTDARVTTSSKIIAVMSGAAPTGKDADEVTNFETGFDIYCTNGSGSFTLVMRAKEGTVTGAFKINYHVG